MLTKTIVVDVLWDPLAEASLKMAKKSPKFAKALFDLADRNLLFRPKISDDFIVFMHFTDEALELFYREKGSCQ